MLQTLAVILDALGRPVGGSGNGTAARAAGDHLCGEMIDRHDANGPVQLVQGNGPGLVGFGAGEAPPHLAQSANGKPSAGAFAPLRPHTLLAMYK